MYVRYRTPQIRVRRGGHVLAIKEPHFKLELHMRWQRSIEYFGDVAQEQSAHARAIVVGVFICVAEL